MKKIRRAAVAGSFYPEDAESLQSEVSTYLDIGEEYLTGQAEHDSSKAAPPVAIIAPHAGYVYSGPIAGIAYSALKGTREFFNRVAIIGPAHYVGGRGIFLSSADEFSTPLGNLKLDDDLRNEVLKFSFARINDEAHQPEHSLEVQLPFLQTILEKFSILPILIGEASDQDVATVIASLLAHDRLLLVISSDLSHYLTYDEAITIDEKTATAIETLSESDLTYNSACGLRAICGLIHYAKQHQLQATTLCLASSGDTAGGKDRVVGYGAFAINKRE